MDFFAEPLHQLILVGVAALILVVVWRSLKGRPAVALEKTVDPKTRSLVASGDYVGAAQLAQRRGDHEAALDYYLRAQHLDKAAQIAQRLGRDRQAAELYEQGGDHERAARLYRKAGLSAKAKEMNRLHKEGQGQAGASLGLSIDGADGQELSSPEDRANQAANAFEALLTQAKQGEDVAKGRLEDSGRHAADALLAAGDSRRAAEICRDAGLTDQAINLFVNLLGDPGSAAPLLAARGDHKRAAELYEQAGLQQRALDSWISWSGDASEPLECLDAVGRLGDDAAVTWLDALAEGRAVEAEPELHLQIATAYAERDRDERAVVLLERVVKRAQSPAAQKQLKQIEARVARKQEQRLASDRAAHNGHESASDELDIDIAMDGDSEDALARPMNAPSAAGTSLSESDGIGRPVARSTGARRDPAQGDRTAQAPEDLLSAAQLEQLVNEVAANAAQQAARLVEERRSPEAMPSLDLVVDAEQVAEGIQRASKALARGLEPVNLTMNLVGDAAVAAAKGGPDAEALQRLIGDQAADLQNIEIFYRLGLAQVAAGRWQEAREAFVAVEDVSPGYRDAAKRLEELEKWKSAVVSPTIAVAGAAGNPKDQRYELRGELGRGGMAVVYRAKDNLLDREVALKFLTPELSAQQALVNLFQREAKAAAQLNHQNIVTVYDVGTLEGRAFICMELVSGVTVEDLLEKNGRLTVIEALRIAEHILQALDYAHSRKIIHRDIKPSNMMQNELGVVKLMDFGLAKSVEGKAGNKTTMVAGTPSYMAPEQFTGKNVNASSDMFAFGASLYEMLAGRCPFESMRRDSKPPSLRAINPAVPKVLEMLILRTLEFEQEQRLGSAAEMLEPISRVLAQASGHMSGVGQVAARDRQTIIGTGEPDGPVSDDGSKERNRTLAAGSAHQGAPMASRGSSGRATSRTVAAGGRRVDQRAAVEKRSVHASAAGRDLRREPDAPDEARPKGRPAARTVLHGSGTTEQPQTRRKKT